jgi:V/A-type H+-transporting ATPase subunit B
MNLEVSMALDDALDLSWQTLAECFEPQELLMKQSLIDKYFPKQKVPAKAPDEDGGSSTEPDEAATEPGQDQQ